MKFSKALRHIDIEDVKSKHLEEVAVKKLKEERLKEQDEQMKAEYEKWKSNWRAIGLDLKLKSESENKKTKRKSFKKIMKEAMKTIIAGNTKITKVFNQACCIKILKIRIEITKLHSGY